MKAHFSRFLGSSPDRLHLAAHSHHPWPDVTLDAQQRAWLDAADWIDDKWGEATTAVMDEARGHIARLLGLPDPATLATAPNTHEFVVRLLSCLPTPARVLTTDAEFLSFGRQLRRLEEDGRAEVDRVPIEPFDTFADRFAAAAARGAHDLVFFSQVAYNSGFALADPAAIVDAVPDRGTLVVIDGYHGFMARPTDLSAIADRVFYLAGGYKYAMAGEGACFLHCPPGAARRPRNTGWYAGAALDGDAADATQGRVAFPDDGRRFMGATFDPTAWYRFNAVQRLLVDQGVSVADIHAHVVDLHAAFLDRLDDADQKLLTRDQVVPPTGERGNFLAFQTPDAASIQRALQRQAVMCDVRGDRLRLGFGLYHDRVDLDRLIDRLGSATADV